MAASSQRNAKQPTEESREFVYLAFRGKLDKVKALLEQGADPDSLWAPDLTALCEVVTQTNNPEMVKALLDAGANPNQTCYATGSSSKLAIGPVLFAAIRSLNPEVVRLLLEHGANPSAQDPFGDPALCFTVKAGNGYYQKKEEQDNKLLILKYLLEAGQSVNQTNQRGETPLHVAVKENQSNELIMFLLSQGANLNAKNQYDQTPLEVAEARKPRIFALLQDWLQEHRARQVRRTVQGLPIGNNIGGIIANFAVGSMREELPMPAPLSRERLLTPFLQREAEANLSRRNKAVRKLQKAWRNKTARNKPSSRRSKRV